MDTRDTAPDSWEQEDDVEATIDGQLEPAFTTLNVNAKPFVPNVNAAEFIPAFVMKAHPGNLDSGGKSLSRWWATLASIKPLTVVRQVELCSS